MKARLTKKERMRRALFREPVDRLPVQCNYTPVMARKLAAHFNVPVSELPARLDNHLLRVDLTHPKRLSEDGQTAFDWWGAGWDTQTEGYWHAVSPMAGSRNIDAFPWPDPYDPHLFDDAGRAIAADNGRHFVAPNFGM